MSALRRLEGSIDEQTMIAMNARAKLEREPEASVAAGFLAERMGIQLQVDEETVGDRLVRNLRGHLGLVAISLLAAIVVAVPLGVMAARFARFGQLILGIVGIVQTIPFSGGSLSS